MTVRELVELLYKFDPDLEVYYVNEGMPEEPDPKLATKVYAYMHQGEKEHVVL